MIARDSMLRRLPGTLEAEQRLRLETLVFACDLIVLAFSTMRDIAARHRNDVMGINETERAALFMHAWTLVDQIHVFRQLLRDLSNGKFGEKTQAFYDASESALHLRNRMDHLHQNIKNLASQKGMRAPLFGALTYFAVPEDQVTEKDGAIVVKGGTSVVMLTGSVPDGKAFFPSAIPGGLFAVPVSGFKLYAFGFEIALEEAVASIQEIVGRLAETVEKDVRAQVEKISQDTGTPIEQLLATVPFGGRMTLAMTVVFDQPAA